MLRDWLLRAPCAQMEMVLESDSEESVVLVDNTQAIDNNDLTVMLTDTELDSELYRDRRFLTLSLLCLLSRLPLFSLTLSLASWL